MRRAVDRGHDLLGEEEPQDDLVLGRACAARDLFLRSR